MIAREDLLGGGRVVAGERRLSTLCRRHAHIRADIHAVRFIFSRRSSCRTFSRTLWSLFRPCSRAHSRLTRPSLIIQTWGTPLTGTHIPDITFTHVILHQFLETKAANV